MPLKQTAWASLGRLDRALRDKPFVLVVSDSKAGKSRTAYEAARRLWWSRRPHDPGVLVPKGTAAIGPLLDLDPPLDLRPLPALLWLDDLAEGELGELNGELLDRLQNRQVRILATITAQRYGRIEASDTEIGRTARQALHRACVVLLDMELTESERAAAEAAYPNETFEAGIGEQLVAAEILTTRYDTARHGGEPHGWALVQAAIDWVRMDIGRPIRRSELTSLYPIYLRLVRPTDEPRSDLSEPLKWARRAVGSRIALLQPTANGGAEASYQPFDYLVALADGQHNRDAQPIPDDTWSQAARLATPLERNRASTSAYYRRLPGLARTLLLSVIESGDPELAPLAMFNLGSCRKSRVRSRRLGPPTSGPSTPATPSRRRRRCSSWGCCSKSRVRSRRLGPPTSKRSTPATPTTHRRRCFVLGLLLKSRVMLRGLGSLPAGHRHRPLRAGAEGDAQLGAARSTVRTALVYQPTLERRQRWQRAKLDGASSRGLRQRRRDAARTWVPAPTRDRVRNQPGDNPLYRQVVWLIVELAVVGAELTRRWLAGRLAAATRLGTRRGGTARPAQPAAPSRPGRPSRGNRAGRHGKSPCQPSRRQVTR